MLILAKGEEVVGIVVVLVCAAVIIPLLWWMFKRGKANADKALRERLAELRLEPESMKASMFPPAKHTLRHRKRDLWYTLKMPDGATKYARIKMFMLKVISIDMFD
jgi:hypothetical protein